MEKYAQKLIYEDEERVITYCKNIAREEKVRAEIDKIVAEMEK